MTIILIREIQKVFPVASYMHLYSSFSSEHVEIDAPLKKAKKLDACLVISGQPSSLNAMMFRTRHGCTCERGKSHKRLREQQASLLQSY